LSSSVREEFVLDLLRENGPLTGKELQESLNINDLDLWRFCRRHPLIEVTIVGRRYLRLDDNVAGYGRLSPSIKREFLIYTVASLAEHSRQCRERAQEIEQGFAEISRQKIDLARERMAAIAASLSFEDRVNKEVCFVIAGDVVYGMAHREPRPEFSTGRMVNGSDLDVVIVTTDEFPADLTRQLDDAVYREKYRLLILPNYREEIDYIIKNMSRVQKQLAFNNFKHMVACKILHEGKYLYGSRRMFEILKEMVWQAGMDEKLGLLERKADAYRRSAEEELLSSTEDLSEQESWKLFYTEAEHNEIF